MYTNSQHKKKYRRIFAAVKILSFAVKSCFANGTGYCYLPPALRYTQIVFAIGAGEIAMRFYILNAVFLKLEPLFDFVPDAEKLHVFFISCLPVF